MIEPSDLDGAPPGHKRPRSPVEQPELYEGASLAPPPARKSTTSTSRSEPPLVEAREVASTTPSQPLPVETREVGTAASEPPVEVTAREPPVEVCEVATSNHPSSPDTGEVTPTTQPQPPLVEVREDATATSHPLPPPEAGEVAAIQFADGFAPTDCVWFKMYVSGSPAGTSGMKTFQRRFGLPFVDYKQLAEDACREGWFWGEDMPCAAEDNATMPLELFILGALRSLQRGWGFDDSEETTNIPEAKHRAFFHNFVEFGATVLANKYEATREMKKLVRACEKAHFHPDTVAALEPDDFF